MILETTFDMYKSFLDGINKGGSYSINIDAFNRIINDWGQDEWIKNNVIKPEINETLIDRLSVLKISTDDEMYYSQRIDGSSAYLLKSIPCNKNWSSTPHPTPDVENYFKYPLRETSIDGIEYPSYLRLLNIEFKIIYLAGSDCNRLGESDWLGADVLRSDNEIPNKKNPFRRPEFEKMYYELIGDMVRLVHGPHIEGFKMKIKYLRNPNRIFLNKNSILANDEQSGIPDYTGSINGSVNCEFQGILRKEIIDLAIRVFLERVGDVRYKSYLNELNIKDNG